MSYIISIIFLISPKLLLQILANSTTVADLQVHTKSNSTPSKQTSYYYQAPQGPGTYEFGYYLEDKSTENIQYRNETKISNDTVIGSYGFLRPDGIFTIINYIADKNGYRIKKGKSNKIHPLDSSLLTNETTSTSTSTTTESSGGLNLTSAILPPILVDEVMDKFDIDLSPDASPGDVLYPNITEIINGEISLKNDTNNLNPDVKVVQNFIPSNFPIAPFHLPSELYKKSQND